MPLSKLTKALKNVGKAEKELQWREERSWSVHETVAFKWTCSLVTAFLQAKYLLVEEQMSDTGYGEKENVFDCIKRGI